MPTTVDYIDIYNGQPTTGLNNAHLQHLFIFAYISDGAGNPAPDGTTVYVTDWITGSWDPGCVPVPENSHSSPVGRDTRNGFVLVQGGFGTGGSLRVVGWSVQVTNTSGAGPDFTLEFDCTGGVDVDPALFATPPVLVGVPGDQEVSWEFTPGVLLDDRGFARQWRIDVVPDPGVPAANPFVGVLTDTQPYLSTGLTNGMTYNANVDGLLLFTDTIGGDFNFWSSLDDGQSNIASATPRAVILGVSLDSIQFAI